MAKVTFVRTVFANIINVSGELRTFTSEQAFFAGDFSTKFAVYLLVLSSLTLTHKMLTHMTNIISGIVTIDTKLISTKIAQLTI